MYIEFPGSIPVPSSAEFGMLTTTPPYLIGIIYLLALIMDYILMPIAWSNMYG